MDRRIAARLLLALAAAASVLPSAHALSWPLCNDGGQVWVTERPRTEPTFPGANLWFFCESGLNILGSAIDPCINNGTSCTPAVYDALCQGFGFDMAWTEAHGGAPPTVVPANREEAVRSLTGEYCLRRGRYAQEVPADLASLEGEPCPKIDSITCIRNRETIITALSAANLAAFEPTPPAAEPAMPADPSQVPQEAQQAVTSADGGGRRKLLAARR